MPFKSAKSSRFRNVKKYCLWCHKWLKLNNTRDIKRKNYCCSAHRQLWRFKHGEWTMDRMWELCNTPEANQKKSHPKERNPNWLGDRRKLKRPMTSYEGNLWRKLIYKKDDYTCQFCGQRGGKLNADHIKPFSRYPELKWDLSNGRTLCIDCHKKTDTYGGKLNGGDSYSVS